MIKIENLEWSGLETAIRGMRNSFNSWDRTDSDFENDILGPNDAKLMEQLAKGGPVHAKYRRFITVALDITAPLYWWKEFDTYKIGVCCNSCSTMHKIADHEFTIDDFSTDKMVDATAVVLEEVINCLNKFRDLYLAEEDSDIKKLYWWQMIQLLPSSYMQRRTIMMNYEVANHIINDRMNHKLDEWRELCLALLQLPHAPVTFDYWINFKPKFLANVEKITGGKVLDTKLEVVNMEKAEEEPK